MICGADGVGVVVMLRERYRFVVERRLDGGLIIGRILADLSYSEF